MRTKDFVCSKNIAIHNVQQPEMVQAVLIADAQHKGTQAQNVKSCEAKWVSTGRNTQIRYAFDSEF